MQTSNAPVRCRAFALVAMLGACQSASIRMERHSSGAAERDFAFDPAPGPDGHYLTFPAHPFVNCFDTIQADDTGDAAVRAIPCDASAPFQGWLGYRDTQRGISWLTDATVRQQADTVRAACRQLGIDLDAAAPTPIASFLHFSDVQIREPGAKLGGQSLSHQLDKLVPSFERSYEQELYSMFVYGALVRTVNKELMWKDPDPERPAPQFMIHTGDAVDAGLTSEFEMFRNYSDMLRIPWYQVIGNHDVLAFGNMQLKEDSAKADDDRCQGHRWKRDTARGGECTCTQLSVLIREQILQNAVPDNLGKVASYSRLGSLLPLVFRRICIRHRIDGDSFIMDPAAGIERRRAALGRLDEPVRRAGRTTRTANSVNTFIAAHCRPPDCQAHVLPSSAADHYAHRPPDTEPAAGRASRCAELRGRGGESVMHGFDLLRGFDANELGAPDTGGPAGGYYCFEIRNLAPTTGRRIWAVVLNTVAEEGAYGAFPPLQQTWLQDVLERSQIEPHDLVLIFAHHPIWDIFNPDDRAELLKLLAGHRNVVGYFAGHTHQPMLRIVHPEHHEGELAYHHFWEVVAPAVISYPQQGRQVTVKIIGDVGYFEILSITPHGTGDSADAVERAMHGAARDYCHDHPEDCADGRPRLASRAVSFPRLFFRLPPRTPATHPCPTAKVREAGQRRGVDREHEELVGVVDPGRVVRASNRGDEVVGVGDPEPRAPYSLGFECL